MLRVQLRRSRRCSCHEGLPYLLARKMKWLATICSSSPVLFPTIFAPLVFKN